MTTSKDIITRILEDYPETRNNDIDLIYRYLLAKDMPTDIAELRHYKTNLFESVRRARQAIQAINPLLQAEDGTRRARAAKEERMREEYRGV